MTHTPNYSRYSRSLRPADSLRCAAKLGVALLSLLSLSAGTVAHAGTVNWDGTAADWFSTPSHWVGGTAPGSGDDAVNNSTAAMTLGQSTTISSFFSNGAFTLNGGTFSGSQALAAGTITVNNVFTDNGGTISNFTIDQGTGGSLVFNNNGGNDLVSSIVNANVSLAGVGFLRVQNANTVNGTINLSTTSNGLNIYDGNANLTLGSGGGLVGFGSVFQSGSGATLTNNGTVNANTSGQTLGLAITNFVNNGTAEATNGGILSLNNTLTNSGALNAIGTGSVVSLSGTLTNGAGNLMTASNGGQIQVNGATLLGTINEASGTTLIFSNSGGNIFANTNINGNLDLATNADAFLRFQGVGTVNGTINLATTSNGLDIYDGNANLTLGSGGGLVGFGSVFQSGSGATLTNNGTVNANTSGQTLGLAITNFVNNGTAEATNGGILSLNNSVTNNGTIAANTGGTVNIAGTLTSNSGSSIDGAGGTVNIQGATLLGAVAETAGTTLVFNNSGGNNFVNTSVSGGSLDLATNADAFLRFQGVGTVGSAIKLGTTSNGLNIYDGNANLTLTSGGSLVGFGSVFQSGGGATLTNNGTVNANVSGQALNLNTTSFVNAGTTEVQNGAALNVTSAVTDSGNVLVKTGGTATFTQNLVQTGGLTQADGTLNSAVSLTGGTLSGTGTVNGNVENNGGTVSAGNSGSPFGTLAVNGTFKQVSNGTLNAGFDSLLSSLLSVNGAVITGGTLDVSYLGAGAYTGTGPFTFLNYGSLTSSITGTAQPQYFSNETFLSDGTGVIAGSNGFTYALLNNTALNGLQLEVLTNGAPTPAVPEASTTLSFGLLLALGGGGLLFAKGRRAA